MESTTFGSPTGRSCPVSPRETPWPPASSSANAPHKSSRHNTHSDVDEGTNYGDLESRGKRPLRRARTQRPNRGRLSRQGIRMGWETTYKQRKLKWLRAQSMWMTGDILGCPLHAGSCTVHPVVHGLNM